MNRTSLVSIFSLVLALGAFGCGDDDRDDDPTGTADMRVPTGDMDGCVATEGGDDAICSDGVDNDCDGLLDCQELGCMGLPACEGGECTPTGEEGSVASCSDGIDNDCNDFIDCRDFACSGIGDCGVENSNASCSDGLDNDNDGRADCEDFDCLMDGAGLNVCVRESNNANCSDGEDNDGDGDVDCDDSDCDREHIVVCGDSPVTDPSMWAAAAGEACSNGLNDDGDMNAEGRAFIDCGDFDCVNTLDTDVCHDLPRENTNERCSDGLDNDGNGTTDCEDFRCQTGENIVVCAGATPVVPTPSDTEITTLANAACSDGLSPDGDAFIDCMDFDCTGDPLVTVCNAENNDALCSDGVDNDGNTFVDCVDNSCKFNPTVTVCAGMKEATVAECTDGVDNDGNSFIDCRDFGCQSNVAACGNNRE